MTDLLTNQIEYRVVGMSRSGNHAIIHWLLSQMNGRYCFLNCAEPKHNPFLTARPLDEDGIPYCVNYAGFDLAQEQQGCFSRKDHLLVSYEDSFLKMVDSPVYEANHDQWVGRSGRRFDILILRDPFNLFASRKKAGWYEDGSREDRLVSLQTARRIWKQHARAFLGRQGYLNNHRVFINYNSWVSSRAYRHDIAQKLGLRFADDAANRVLRVAGGSSFDGIRYHNQASAMKVLHRWEHYLDDPDFCTIFDDQQLVALSQQIFDPIPGLQALLEQV